MENEAVTPTDITRDFTTETVVKSEAARSLPGGFVSASQLIADLSAKAGVHMEETGLPASPESSTVTLRLTERDSQQEIFQISATARRKKSAKEKACRIALGVLTGCGNIDGIPDLGGFKREEEYKPLAGRYEATMRVISKELCKAPEGAAEDVISMRLYFHEVKGVGESKKKSIHDAARRIMRNMARRLRAAAGSSHGGLVPAQQPASGLNTAQNGRIVAQQPLNGASLPAPVLSSRAPAVATAAASAAPSQAQDGEVETLQRPPSQNPLKQEEMQQEQRPQPPEQEGEQGQRHLASNEVVVVELGQGELPALLEGAKQSRDASGEQLGTNERNVRIKLDAGHKAGGSASPAVASSSGQGTGTAATPADPDCYRLGL